MKINSVQDAASVHVAILSVSRWEDSADFLQPHFDITAANAVTMALPTTTVSLNNSVNSTSVGVNIGLEGYGGNPAVQNANALGQNAPSVLNVNAASPNGPAGQTPALTQSAVANAVGTDPFLTYTAATAVYQEIQLLNSYVKDAALRYGYVPYLVRLQVSVMPFAHAEHYDVYVDLGMFSRCGDSNDLVSDASSQYDCAKYIEDSSSSTPIKATGSIENAVTYANGIANEIAVGVANGSAPAIVVPLLVTDDVEAGQATNLMNEAQQLAISLGAVFHSVDLQTALDKIKIHEKAIQGKDFNSLYEVSRAGDNVLEVRLGAASSPDQNSDGGYSMLPQTHNVSFLLLVKNMTCSEPQVRVSSYITLRDSVNGRELSNNSVSEYEKLRKLLGFKTEEAGIFGQAKKLLQRFDLSLSLPPHLPAPKVKVQETKAQKGKEDQYKKCEMGKLLNLIQDGDFDSFHKECCKLRVYYQLAKERPAQCNTLTDTELKSMWTGLTTILSTSRYAGTSFDLPQRYSPPIINDQIILQDNCKDTATATIGGEWNLQPRQLVAALTLASIGNFAATDITSAQDGSFTFKFPSLVPLLIGNQKIKSCKDIKCGAIKLKGSFKIRRLTDRRYKPAPDSIYNSTGLYLEAAPDIANSSECQGLHQKPSVPQPGQKFHKKPHKPHKKRKGRKNHGK